MELQRNETAQSSERSVDGYPRYCWIDRLCASIYIHRFGSPYGLTDSGQCYLVFSPFVLDYSSFCDAMPCQSFMGIFCREVFKLPQESLVFGMHNPSPPPPPHPPPLHRRGDVIVLVQRRPSFVPYPSRVGGRKLISLSLSLSITRLW